MSPELLKTLNDALVLLIPAIVGYVASKTKKNAGDLNASFIKLRDLTHRIEELEAANGSVAGAGGQNGFSLSPRKPRRKKAGGRRVKSGGKEDGQQVG
jgi:hypothetical protein